MTASEARMGVLDEALDAIEPGESFASELFAVVDALGGSVALRRAITDPGRPEGARTGLVHGVFDGKVSDQVSGFVADAAARRWSDGRSFVDALEREAVRGQLKRSDADGSLDETEDELFRFARTIESDRDLRDVLADRSAPLADRQRVVDDLLADRTSPATVVLARRAVAARERTFAHTIEGYVALAAEQKNRVVATVRVAHAMSGEQRSRLQAALTRQVGREVVLQEVIDPDVLGGVRVELGDEVVEGTVASRLDEARRLFG